MVALSSPSASSTSYSLSSPSPPSASALSFSSASKRAAATFVRWTPGGKGGASETSQADRRRRRARRTNENAAALGSQVRRARSEITLRGNALTCRRVSSSTRLSAFATVLTRVDLLSPDMLPTPRPAAHQNPRPQSTLTTLRSVPTEVIRVDSSPHFIVPMGEQGTMIPAG